MTRQATLFAAIFLSSLPSIALAWTPIITNPPARITTTTLHNTDPSNPCWQDNFDSEDDCLSTIYSAHFVAEEWIKSMPCGKDADCLPETLTHPAVLGDGGVEKVDVMEYLKIRKAAPVGGGSSSGEEGKNKGGEGKPGP